jgi:hypothetical protein
MGESVHIWTKPITRTTVAALAAAVVVANFATQANADTTAGPADQAARIVQQATGVADVISANQFNHDVGSAAIAKIGPNTVDVPKDPSVGVTVTTPSGQKIGIGIANADKAYDAKTTASGTIIYADNATGSATAVQPTTDGGVRQSFVITHSAAPSTYRIPVTVPHGFELRSNSNGSIDIVNPVSGDNLGRFDTPWAKDSEGKPVPTGYRLEGNTIVQTVDVAKAHSFPIVADPHYGCSWWSGCTIYLDKTETKLVSTGANIVGWIPSAWTVIGGRYVWLWAQIAANEGKCIKISNAFWICIYSEGYCT